MQQVSLYSEAQKEEYYKYLSKRTELIVAEQKSVEDLNEIYKLHKIPIKITMVATNEDEIINHLQDIKLSKGRMPLLGKSAPVDVTVSYDIKLVTALRLVIADIANELGSDIGKCIRVKHRRDGKRTFILHLRNITEQAIVDDIFDAIHNATDNEIDRRRKKLG